jgi:hypothetical protein
LGSTKIDLHSKERFYQDLTLSDIDVLQLLIEYRYKYDKYVGHETNNAFTEAGQVVDVNVEVIATYASLDQLIKQCEFSKEQMKILEMIEQGYELLEVAKEMNIKKGKNIRSRFNKILRDIAKMNDWNWRNVIYTQRLELKTKTCTKCKKRLPATAEFYRERSDNKGDGFYNNCRLCEK